LRDHGRGGKLVAFSYGIDDILSIVVVVVVFLRVRVQVQHFVLFFMFFHWCVVEDARDKNAGILHTHSKN